MSYFLTQSNKIVRIAELKMLYTQPSVSTKKMNINDTLVIPVNQIKKTISAHNTTINCKPGEMNYNQYVNSTEY